MTNKTNGIFIPLDLIQIIYKNETNDKATEAREKPKQSKKTLYPCRVETAITKEMNEEINRMAKEYGITKRDLLREALYYWMNRYDCGYGSVDKATCSSGVV